MIKIIAFADLRAIKCNHGVIYSHRQGERTASCQEAGHDMGGMVARWRSLGIGLPFCKASSLRDRVHRDAQTFKPCPHPHIDPSARPRTSDMLPSKMNTDHSLPIPKHSG